jgi:hypothetical protein
MRDITHAGEAGKSAEAEDVPDMYRDVRIDEDDEVDAAAEKPAEIVVSISRTSVSAGYFCLFFLQKATILFTCGIRSYDP